MVVWFSLILYVPFNIFSVMSGEVFLGLTSSEEWIKCLAQRHNTVTPLEVRLEQFQGCKLIFFIGTLFNFAYFQVPWL